MVDVRSVFASVETARADSVHVVHVRRWGLAQRLLVSRGHIVGLSSLPAIVASQTLLAVTHELATIEPATQALLADCTIVETAWTVIPPPAAEAPRYADDDDWADEDLGIEPEHTVLAVRLADVGKPAAVSVWAHATERCVTEQVYVPVGASVRSRRLNIRYAAP